MRETDPRSCCPTGHQRSKKSELRASWPRSKGAPPPEHTLLRSVGKATRKHLPVGASDRFCVEEEPRAAIAALKQFDAIVSTRCGWRSAAYLLDLGSAIWADIGRNREDQTELHPCARSAYGPSHGLHTLPMHMQGLSTYVPPTTEGGRVPSSTTEAD